jgi:ATP-dependent exoDNAse (exonuclease V) beta subunit
MKLNTKFNYPKSIRAYYNGQRLYDVNSEKLPSVTTILNATKSERDKAKLEEWRKRVGAKAADQISKEALSRGSSMHDFLEKFILNQLNLDLLGDNSLEKQMADQIIENGLRNDLSEVYGVEATQYYPGKYAGAADLLGVYMGKETILDFKTGNKPRRDEWNDEYYLQLGAYSLAHDKVYGTNINQGVILLCTKDLMFQRFIVDSERLKDCQKRFLEKVEQYYSMKLNS